MKLKCVIYCVCNTFWFDIYTNCFEYFWTFVKQNIPVLKTVNSVILF